MPPVSPQGLLAFSRKIPLAAKLHVWLPAVLLLFVFQSSALADTIYTYTGNDFTFLEQPEGYPNAFTTSDYVSITLTISGPPIVCLTLCSIPSSDISMSVMGPEGFEGLIAAGSVPTGMVQTDSSGAIVAWTFHACMFVSGTFPDCEDRSIDSTDVGSFVNDFAELGNGTAGNSGESGVWTMTEVVPEPNTLLTFASGVALLAGVARRRWSSR